VVMVTSTPRMVLVKYCRQQAVTIPGLGIQSIQDGDRDMDGVDPIIGVDKCIYWPPTKANRVLKFDP
jgi:hypothetical protein